MSEREGRERPQNQEAPARAASRPLAPGASLPANALTKRRKWAALAVAAASDAVQMALFPLFIEGAISPWELALDVATAVVILLLCGFKWRLAIALATELVPGIDLFPTWTALVLTLPTGDPPPALPR